MMDLIQIEKTDVGPRADRIKFTLAPQQFM